MANIGVTFDFAAESAKLRTEIDKVRKEVGSLNATAKGIEKGFKTLGTAIVGAFSIGQITSFLTKVNQIADGLNDLSGRLGASASGLQVLQVAAAQAGGSADAMNTALAKMSSTIGDALNGNKQAAAAFDRLNLSIRELSALKADQAFAKIAEQVSRLPNSYDRASVAQDIFGKGAKDIAGLLAEGNAAIEETNRKLAEQGALLDDIDIAKIGVVNDELQLQSTIVDNLGIKFLSGLTPAISVAVATLGGMTNSLGGATEAGRGFGVIMVASIKAIESAAYGLAAIFEGVRAVVSGVLYVIVSGVQNVVQSLAFVSESLNLGFAESLRAASDQIDGIADSLDSVSVSATENAKKAAAAALNAGLQVAQAGVIFDQYSAQLEQRAAQAAQRSQQAQGASTGTGATGKDGKPFDPNKGMLENYGRISLVLNDPVKDPRFLLEQSVGQAILDLKTQNFAAQEELTRNSLQNMLGSFLEMNELIVAVEEAKTQTLGQTFQDLVATAAQSTGAMGKVGKAYAIAQTIWSTGTAIMKAMAEIPFPKNIGVAAMVAAKGAMQLSSIRKTNIGSGGSISAGSSSIGSTAATPDSTKGLQSTESQEKSATQIIINGNVFSSQETANWMIEQISNAVNNRDLVFISGNSRQAMELAGA